jgi:hypothetical protein
MLGVCFAAAVKKFAQDKLLEMLGLAAIVVVVAFVTGLASFVLGLFSDDGERKDAIARMIGEYIGKGLLGLCLVVGAIEMWRKIYAKLNDGREPQLPLPRSWRERWERRSSPERKHPDFDDEL